ncbi:hypothetical protein DDB_G0292706 [Dictyostelium discoideum AX4]|nr:hypothetical protein DDB_G0292706 [Dictyostelium discoideum AX4]EAL61156.1 hypothetical protein DDB_G0292706 [Dictyostelium discoideum AX4]|eukprot:XP_629546.1 hypothetical protein DDB_G0292706 [Dictyostelium discoideum AX4]
MASVELEQQVDDLTVSKVTPFVEKNIDELNSLVQLMFTPSAPDIHCTQKLSKSQNTK